MSTEKQEMNTATNRAKLYQLILFPMNNGATNVYYILTMNFIAYYANGVLGLLLMFATTMVTVMRLFDAVTDPIIGALIDRTSGKFGKFRPYMILGNVIMIVSSILMYFGTRLIAEDMAWLKYFDSHVFWNPADRRGYGMAEIYLLCTVLCVVCNWLYIPDGMYTFRSDLSDK